MNISNKRIFKGFPGQYIADEEKNGSYTATLSGKKYYISPLPEKNAENVKRMISLKTPKRLDGSVEERILWPVEVLEEEGGKWCVMSIPDTDSFKRCTFSLYDLLSAHIRVTPAAIYRICASVAEVYSLLSMLGFYYNIYSLEDITFDIKSGEICIKNTHLLLTGTDVANISGTPLFMAPETVDGISGINRHTNIYSCLTYLFCLIYRVHPLHGASRYSCSADGRIPDYASIKKIYGQDGEFCFFKSDNAPVEAAEALGFKETDERVRELFKKLYTEGLKEYKKRDTLHSAYEIFNAVAKSYPSAAFSPGGILSSVIKLSKEDDAAKKIVITNSSLSCTLDLGDCSALAAQLLKMNLNISISITSRGGGFYLTNIMPYALSYSTPSGNSGCVACPGGEIRLTKGLIIELPPDNNKTVLKFL